MFNMFFGCGLGRIWGVCVGREGIAVPSTSRMMIFVVFAISMLDMYLMDFSKDILLELLLKDFH